MFEDDFVPANIAIALREAGFNEPCMAAWEHYAIDHHLHSKLVIAYSNQVSDPSIYNEVIQSLLKSRPGIFEGKRRNCDLKPWQYGAPLYAHVSRWFFAQGLRIHDCYIAKDVYALGDAGAWVCSIYDTRTGKSLWPPRMVYVMEQGLTYDLHGRKEYGSQRAAWDAAILAAIKLLPK